MRKFFLRLMVIMVTRGIENFRAKKKEKAK